MGLPASIHQHFGGGAAECEASPSLPGAGACQSSSSPKPPPIAPIIISMITFAYQLLLFPIMRDPGLLPRAADLAEAGGPSTRLNCFQLLLQSCAQRSLPPPLGRLLPTPLTSFLLCSRAPRLCRGTDPAPPELTTSRPEPRALCAAMDGLRRLPNQS